MGDLPPPSFASPAFGFAPADVSPLHAFAAGGDAHSAAAAAAVVAAAPSSLVLPYGGLGIAQAPPSPTIPWDSMRGASDMDGVSRETAKRKRGEEPAVGVAAAVAAAVEAGVSVDSPSKRLHVPGTVPQ
jgi:hypothetical protein